MKTKLILLSVALLMGVSACSIHKDCRKKGQTKDGEHTWVDLGLPSGLKWATCNVGAEKPEDYGYYYAWGQILPKEDYSWTTYKYANIAYNKLTKYCTDAGYGDDGFTDNKTILAPEDDAAHINWRGNWRMPTKDEWQELMDNCVWVWTTQNGVNGYLVTGKTNGNSIFLPAAGFRNGTSFYNVGHSGDYWSSSLLDDRPRSAWYVSFDSDDVHRYDYFRYYGQSVRPVCAFPTE